LPLLYTLAPVKPYARMTPLWMTAAMLFCAPAADAMIQVDRGIAGARLGNTRAEVRAALGTPSKTTTGSNDFGPFVRYTFAGKIRVTFQGKTHVTAVETTGLGDRTSTGIGVGSSEASLKSKVKGLTCEDFGSVRSCHTGDFLAGKKVTDFRISGGKVESVTVAIVID
jgi:hypothetical protein